MFRGEREPSDIPLIQHWTNDKLQKRMVEEKEAGFGDCDMDKKTYPVCLTMKSDVSNCESTKPSSSSSKRIVEFKLPDGLHTDEEISLISEDEIQELLLLLKRDVELFNLIHADRLNRIKLLIKQRDVKRQDLEEPSQSNNLSENDKFLGDSVTVKQIDVIVENIYKMRETTKTIPSFELFTEKQYGNYCQEGYNGTGDEEFDKDRGKELDVKYDLLSLWCSFDCSEPSNGQEFVSVHMSRNEDNMRILPLLQQELVDYCMFRIPTKDDTKFKTYGISHMETLFNYNEDEYVISRNEMVTLEFHHEVSSGVICAWSLLLKDMERKRKCEDKRFFFGTDHMVYFQDFVKSSNGSSKVKANSKKACSKLRNSLKVWVTNTTNSLDHLLKATKIFLPMLMEGHYFCCVINFNSKKLQYLDNRKYSPDELEKFTGWAVIMGKELSVVLRELFDKRASLIPSFEVEVVPFPWQSTQVNLDCRHS